ncbi:MBG domain-containing protein [Martelella endophytica]|uniref:beta strand repeat-containing protein n=1 Tax=Martelella endophytica TaxID=1486262 RepID=UPI001FCD1F34
MAGYNYGKISNAYATGSVSGGSYYVGGLVGFNDDGTISNAYATGSVSGDKYVGGLVGFIDSGTITASYFDTDTTKQSNGVGGGSAAGVTGLTTAEARTQAGYTGFDFDNTWYQAGDMRPILRSEAAASVDGVITVSNLHQLALMGADLSASYRLSGDIDASATDASDASGIWSAGGFVPIGNNGSAFTGTFDGDGHVITGLTINRTSADYIGLFGYTDSGSILRNVGLDGGSVTGSFYVGGLVGYNYDGTIGNAYATGSVTGRHRVGGLVGYSHSGTISNAYASGSVTGLDGVGGLVGYNASGTISNAYASGSVAGSDYVGGLVGFNNSSTISNAYATGSVRGGYDVGGLVGYSHSGTISNAYASGSVAGSEFVGGLVGYNTSGTISNAYATGSVAGSEFVGGLVGFNNSSTISNAYATGSLTGGSRVGGLVGYNTSGTISNAYATGSVAGSEFVGGLVGFNNSGTITASYFDTDTTNQSNGVGDGDGDVTGLTTEEFQDTAEFYARALAAGWNFETVWAPPSEGYYPELYALSDVVFVKTDGQTITYGDAPAALTYSGVYGGHSGAGVFAPTLTTDATATSNVGSYAISGQSSFVGDDGIIYRTVYGPGEIEISPRAITVTADDTSKIYGDTASLSYKVTSGTLVNGDTLSGALASDGAAATADAADYLITRGTLANSNYAISFVNGNLQVDKAILTITANGGSMVYGNAVPNDLGYTTGGWKNDQTSALLSGVTVGSDATGTSDVGAGYITIASGGMLSGDAAGNYAFDYVNGSFAVTPRALVVTASDASKTYGDAFTPTQFAVTGLVNGDQVDAVTLTSAGAAVVANAGSYDIIAANATGSGLSNYAINYVDGTLTVAKAKLTVTADNGAMIYGDVVPTIGYSVSGWKNGQGDALLTGVNVATDATSTSNVGNAYATMAASGNLTGAASGNYTLEHVNGSFAVTPRALTVTASDAVKTYGDTASLTGFTTTGLVNGDSVAAVSEKSLGADAEADAGVYDIIASAATGTGLSNYDISYGMGTLTVDKAALTVTADNGSMIYGDAVPMIGYAVSGWKNGQNGSLLSGVVVTTDATSSSDVGTGYSTAASRGALLGAAAGNYDISYQDGSMTVERRAITVAANAGAKTYGDLGLLTYTVGGMGLANGDRLSGKLESDGQAMLANVGSYAVTQGSVTDAFNRNYAISYRANTLAVTPRPITLTAVDAVKQLGTQAGVLGWQVTAGNLVDGGASLNGNPASRGAPSSATVGTYAITAGSLTDAENPNYAITFLPGKLEVLPVLAPSAPAGGVPLPSQQFDPFTVAGGSLQEALFADNSNPPGTLIDTDQSPVSNAACDAGPQVLFICR